MSDCEYEQLISICLSRRHHQILLYRIVSSGVALAVFTVPQISLLSLSGSTATSCVLLPLLQSILALAYSLLVFLWSHTARLSAVPVHHIT